MLMEVKVFQESGAVIAWAQLDLDFTTKKWSIQEDTNWSSLTVPKSGSFELQSSGAMCLRSDIIASKTNVIMLWNAPMMDPDAGHLGSGGEFSDPFNSRYKDAIVAWTVKELSPLRQTILAICKGILLPTPDKFLTPGVAPMTKISDQMFATGGVTNCGEFPGWVAEQLGGGALVPQRVQLPRYQIADGSFVTPDPLLVTSPMTAWEEFIADLQNRAALQAGTWVPYDFENHHKRPQPGDIYTLAKSPNGKFAHVGIMVDSVGSIWITADSGQGSASAEEIDIPDPANPGKTKKRVKFSAGMAAGYRRRVFHENGSLTGEFGDLAWLKGWVNVEKLFSNWKA